MREKLFFYYTNDLHSHFDNWSKIVSFLNEKKQQRKKEKNPFWLIDIGDHVDRSHPIAEAMMGKENVSLLNDAEYDFVTIGNNEGITLDYEHLYHLYDEANFSVVCANIQSIRNENPSWLKPSVQVTSPSGLRIAFIGLTAPFNAFYHLLGWDIQSPYDTLSPLVKNLKEHNDIVILLSHLGISDDREIARRYPEIDVIIGGHTHHLLKNGEKVGDSLLTAAGKHGYYVGEVQLTWDHQQAELIEREAYAVNINHIAEDKITKSRLQTLNHQALKVLNKRVTTLSEKLDVDWFDETKLMKLLVETLQEWTESDCSMLNAGLILNKLEAGKVTYGDVHRICPHPINPCLVELTGQELMEVVRGSLTRSFMELKLKGFGFRGHVIGKMIFSGLEVETKKNLNGDYQVTNVLLNGLPVDMNKSYLVATADTFTFGNLLPEVARSKTKQYFLPEFLRDILAHTLKTKL